MDSCESLIVLSLSFFFLLGLICHSCREWNSWDFYAISLGLKYIFETAVVDENRDTIDLCGFIEARECD